MTFIVLAESGKVVYRKSVWAFTSDELQSVVRDDLAKLAAAVTKVIGDSLDDSDIAPEILAQLPPPPDEMAKELFDNDGNVPEPMEPEASRPDADEYTPEAYDEYLAAGVVLPLGGEAKKATVTKRTVDAHGVPVGVRHSNPMLDTRMYDVTYPDGSTDSIAANLIAENLYSQVDAEGRSFAILEEIIDYRKTDEALTKANAYGEHKGRRYRKRTTVGWELEVLWKDGSTDWIPLKDLKDANPIEVAEYAVSSNIADEPAFAWWVHDTLRKRERIVKKAKTRYWKRTHKYGVELPKSVEEALAIDRNTQTDFWRKAIEKEMKNVMPAFEFRDDDTPPIGYKHIKCHMVFDVKLIGLVRKARFVAGGHETDPPAESTYSSVVSRDSVRLAFLIAALNDLDILSADVQNAYLNAPTKEKVYTTAGLEFGESNKDRPVMIVRALYGLKSSGARWRDHMAATLREGGFVSTKGDPDVWMRPAVKPNGFKYYEYVLCYVDDILAISHAPQAIMDHLSSKYTLKEGSVKPPDTYLGADIKEFKITDSDDPDKVRWALSSETYVKRVIGDVEQELDKAGKRLRSKVTTPISQGYRPELDVSPELGDRQVTYYQGLIGVLRWICELGRLDILVEVSMLSRFLASPREGHLDETLHVFAYLKSHTRSTLVFDDTLPTFDHEFQQADWSEYYPGAKEAMPPNMPEPRGHSGDRATRRSHSGVLIFVNRAPIMWFSKRQNTVETSTFGSEFIAMKQAVEMIEGLRYKIRMMGIEISGPTSLFCDNQSVVKNAS